MKFGKRRKEPEAPDAQAPASAAASAAPPVTQSWTMAPDEAAPAYEPPQPAAAAAEEPVVEGEAVELPAAEFHQPVPLTGRHPEAAADPTGLAGQPVAVSPPGAAAAPVTALGDSGEAFASGHGAGPGPSWQEPVVQLANERPELVVGAAFAGGVLAAMILRRLGN